MTRPVRTDFIARDQTSPVMDRISGKAEGMGSKFAAVGARIGMALAGAATAMTGLAAAGAVMGVKTAAALEQAQIGFETLLGSGQKADKFLKDLSKFAASTPFELPGLVSASRQLIGVGASAKSVIPTLQAWGDAAGALGVGQEEFSRVMIAVTQSMAKGKVQAEELMQITEAGIPIYPLLAKAMGKTVPEIQKLGEQGKLLAKDVFPALEKQMAKDYGGSMEKQSKSLTGLWSTFMDTLNIGLADVIKPLMPALKTGLGGAIGFFGDKLKAVSTWVTDTGIPAFKNFASGVETAWDDLKLKLPKVDWAKLGTGIKGAASEWGGDILAGLKIAVQKGDWGPLGKSLGDALRKALSKIGDIAKALDKWADGVDWVEVGKTIGERAAGFAIGFVTGLGADLFTAEFWKKHWWDFIMAALSVLLVGKIAGPLSKLFSKIPILKWFAPLLEKFNKLTEPFNKAIGKVLTWFGRQFATGFRRVFPQAAKGLRHFFDMVVTWVGVKAIMLREWALRMADEFIGGMVRGIGQGTAIVLRWLGRLVKKVLSPFTNAGRWLIRRGRDLVRGLREGVGAAASRLGGWLKDKLWAPVSNVLGAIRRSFSNGVQKIGEVWARLKEKTRKPVQVIIDVAYNNGIRKLWNTVNNLWGGKDLKPIKFARGGVIPMVVNRPTAIVGEGNTHHPEYVIPTDPQHRKRALALYESLGAQLMESGGIVGLMRKAGGGMLDLFSSPAKWLRKILSAPLSRLGEIRDTMWGRGIANIPGRIVDRMVDKAKGLVGLGGGGGGGLGSDPGGSVASILRVARMFQHNAQVSSGYRAGDPGYHGRGLAADLIGGGAVGMKRIARGFYTLAPRLLELIHTNGNYFVKNGAKVGAGYYRSVLGQHWNHVHVAARKDALSGYARNIPAGIYDDGGIIPPGAAGVNLSRRPEAVFTEAQWAAIERRLSEPATVQGDDSAAAAFVMAMFRKGVVKIVGPKGTVQRAVMGRA